MTFVSVISDFIEQKKRELGDLSEKEKKIAEEINRYELQKRELIQEIEILEQETQSIIVYHNTFLKLSKILMEECDIDLKKESRAIHQII